MVCPEHGRLGHPSRVPRRAARTVAADIESMARKMDPMQRMLLQCFLARSLRERVRQAPCPGFNTRFSGCVGNITGARGGHGEGDHGHRLACQVTLLFKRRSRMLVR